MIIEITSLPKNVKALGGYSIIENNDGFTNGVIRIKEGGSHEINPYGGVNVGIGENLAPNLLEEGEVIYNDYVFSNRLSPTEEQLESVKLPKKFKGKPYSDIAWALQKESQENPLDKISKNTLTDSMMKLTTIQEQSRERDREYEAFANLESVFADGGEIHIKDSKKGTFTAAAKKHGMGVQEFASKVLANKDNYSPAMVRKANFARNASHWSHAFGGPMGNMFEGDGPDVQLMSRPTVPTLNGSQYLNFTPPTNKPQYSLFPEGSSQTQLQTPVFGMSGMSTPIAGIPYYDRDGNLRVSSPVGQSKDDPLLINPSTSNSKQQPTTSTVQRAPIVFNPSLATTLTRAVPVIGSSINALADAFGWRNKEDYSALDLIKQREDQIRNVKTSPLGNRMKYIPYDVDYEMNRLQNLGLGAQRSVLDTAGGNALAARNATLALNKNVTEQMGSSRRAGAQYNDNLRRAVDQFNADIDKFNAQQALQAEVYNQKGDVERMEGAIRRAALMDAIQSATSQARSTEETAALNNWGQFGNDRMFAEMVAAYPELMGLSNGTISRLLGTYTQAKGGKLSRVKEFKKK